MKVFKQVFVESTFAKDENSFKERAFSLSKVVGELSQDTASLVYNYMTTWPVFLEWLSPEPDPLNSKILIPSCERSDGVYVWTEMHCHLVKTYRIGLPADFLEHVDKQLVNEVRPEKDTVKKIKKWRNTERSKIESRLQGRSFLGCILEQTEVDELIVDFNQIS